MAADMHIHILEGVTEHQVKRFGSSTLGGPFCNYVSYQENSKHFNDDYDAISCTPQIWVGEVSWLKAAFSDDPEAFIPDMVGFVRAEFDDGLVVIDDAMIERVEAALQAPNTTGYSVGDNEIVEFLKEHKGKKAFTVSW